MTVAALQSEAIRSLLTKHLPLRAVAIKGSDRTSNEIHSWAKYKINNTILPGYEHGYTLSHVCMLVKQAFMPV